MNTNRTLRWALFLGIGTCILACHRALADPIKSEEVQVTGDVRQLRFDTQQHYDYWTATGTALVRRQAVDGRAGLACELKCDGFSQSAALFPHWFMVHVYRPDPSDTSQDVDSYFIITKGTSAVSLGGMKGKDLSASIRAKVKGDGFLGGARPAPPGEYWVLFLFGTENMRMSLLPYGFRFLVTPEGAIEFFKLDKPAPGAQQTHLSKQPAPEPPKPVTVAAHHPDLPAFAQLRVGRREHAQAIDLTTADTEPVARFLVSTEGEIQALRKDEPLNEAVQVFRGSHKSEPLVVSALIAGSREGAIEAVQFSAFGLSADDGRQRIPSGGHMWMVFPVPFKQGGARFAAEYGATDWYEGLPNRGSVLPLYESPSLTIVVSDLQGDQRGRLAGRVYALVPASSIQTKQAPAGADGQRPPYAQTRFHAANSPRTDLRDRFVVSISEDGSHMVNEIDFCSMRLGGYVTADERNSDCFAALRTRQKKLAELGISEDRCFLLWCDIDAQTLNVKTEQGDREVARHCLYSEESPRRQDDGESPCASTYSRHALRPGDEIELFRADKFSAAIKIESTSVSQVEGLYQLQVDGAILLRR